MQRRLLEEMRALKARLDPAVLHEAQKRAQTLPTDRRSIERAVAIFLSARRDGGRLMRDIFAELERGAGQAAPQPAPRGSCRR